MTIEYDESLELYFLAEASDLLQTIEQNLFNILEEKTTERVHTLMRGAHTIKGSAGSCNFKTVETIAHHLEDVFQALYAEDLIIDNELGTLLVEGYECLREPLVAILSQRTYDEEQILDRTADVFARLQDKLGDFFGREAPLPSSEELGFDVVGLIFGDSVPQDLQQLELVLGSGDSQKIGETLLEKANFFGELAASYELPGLAVIAETIVIALEQNPDKVVEIAIAALTNLQEAYETVMAGDRHQGGSVSVELSSLAGLTLMMGNDELMDLVGELNSDLSSSNVNNYEETEEDNLLALVEDNIPETIDTFSRVEDSGIFGILGQESGEDEFAFVNWEIEAEEKGDDSPATEIFAVHYPSEEIIAIIPAESTKPEEAGQLVIGSESAITIESPIDRILQSIWLGKTDGDKAKPAPPKLPDKYKSTADLPTIRVAIEQIERLDRSIAELSIGDSQQNLQSEQLERSVQSTFEQFLGCQQQLEKIRDWSDKNFLLPESQQSQRQQTAKNNRQAQLTTSQFDSLEMDVYSDLHILLQNLSERMLELGEKIESIDNAVQKFRLDRNKRKQVLGSAKEDILQARTVAVSTIFQRFPRLVQQMISVYHKPAQLQIIGADVLVDKAIAEKLYDPLLHLIRNAYDHGLEDIETRLKQGKEPTGMITLRAHHQGNRTTIVVSDDGSGLNWERIRAKAIERNLLLPSQAANISESELAQVLFEPGFSTAVKVSDLSGRGVGLDVVRSQLQAVQGSVSVRSTMGAGTTFILQIPLNLTTARLLVCQSQGITYALLSDSIERVLLSRSEQIQQQPSLTGKGMDTFLRWVEEERTQLIPVRSINDLINYQYPLIPRTVQTNLSSIPFPKQKTNSLLILKRDRERICLDVEQTLVEQELTIVSFGNGWNLPSYVQGYCVLGDGSLTLVIDPIELAIQDKQSQSNNTSPFVRSIPQNLLQASSEIVDAELIEAVSNDSNVTPSLMLGSSFTILVVEDSIVQRQNIVRSFSKAGYQIIQAGNGREALAQLKQHSNISAIVCDIEMPHMNGFEFLSYRRQDYHLAQIPTIMLTSRGGQKHRQFAMALGANGYITKPYADRELLEMVVELSQKVVSS